MVKKSMISKTSIPSDSILFFNFIIGAWRSLVAHLLWEQGVGGSNPLAPTILPSIKSNN